MFRLTSCLLGVDGPAVVNVGELDEGTALTGVLDEDVVLTGVRVSARRLRSRVSAENSISEVDLADERACIRSYISGLIANVEITIVRTLLDA